MSVGSCVVGISFLAASLLFSGPVRGDDFHRVSSDDEYWSLVDTDEGCLWIKVTGEWNYSSNEFATVNKRNVNWSGSCDKDGLIDGPGTLTIESFKDGLISKYVFKGSASEGFFHGNISTEQWDDWGDGSGYQEGQGWFDYQYDMGCVDLESASGCQPAAGLAFRDTILGGSFASSATSPPIQDSGKGASASTQQAGTVVPLDYPSSDRHQTPLGR